VRILLRPRLPVLALLLFAPAIPELLTGSTPITPLFYDPIQFLLSFAFDVALYGTGALLIREYAVVFHKGWASILLLGAAYGIAEEGFAVHTFFQTSGSPVDALGVYGHALGVNWVWALGLTAFHATYSIALPILLTQLWFPGVKSVRWFDNSAIGLVGAIYLLTVLIFDLAAKHGPTPAAFAFFLAVALVLLFLSYWVPADLLRVRPGPARSGPWAIAFAGTLLFDAWIIVLILSGSRAVPAVAAAAIFVLINLAALWIVLRRIGLEDLDWSKLFFATGMLGILFAWDAVVAEFSVPGIVLVAAVFAYLQYRLRNVIRSRSTVPPAGAVAPGAT
jgi:hypothetical protein